MADNSLKYVYIANDGVEFPVSFAVLQLSKTMQGMMASCNPDDPNVIPVPIAKADGATLKLVVEWSQHHENDEEQGDAEAEKTNILPAWDKEFLNSRSYKEIVALCSAANFMDMPKLMLYLAIHVGSLGANKDHNETARFYGYEVTDFKTMCFK